MKIVFMGTPQFAVPCLQRLLEDGHELAAVFTQPDKPQGRKMVLTAPPVKQLALEHHLPVHQPATLRDGSAVQLLRTYAPELIVVVAYGKILPKEILQLPPYGCVNVHASLLPKYRGAGPIQWSVINGETVTGVTSMYMSEGLDTGDMILRHELPIDPMETAGQLQQRLAQLGAQCLSETVQAIAAGCAPRTPQPEDGSSYAPMLTRQMAEIDFTRPAQQVHNLIRGMHPWPVAYTHLDGKTLKVHAAAPVDGYSGQPGCLLDDRRLIIGCGQGAIELLQVQLEGAKQMDAQSFLRGKKLNVGKIFTSH